MSTHFVIEAWTHQKYGTLQRLAGEDTRFSVNNAEIFPILVAIENRQWRQRSTLFSWYHNAYDAEGDDPKAQDCFSPKKVLSSVQGIERELLRNAKKYPARWLFSETLSEGSQRSYERLDATYETKPCRLYSDDKGCWAMILDSPDKYKPHYDLSELSWITVELEGRTIELTLQRRSLLVQSQNVWDGIRRVCLRAGQENAMVLTMILH